MAFPLSLKPRSTRGVGAHAEWGLYKILEYMGLHEILPTGEGKNRTKLRKDIEEYHLAYGINFEKTDIDTFISRRLEGLALDKKKNMRTLRIHQSNGHQAGLGREDEAGEKRQI